MLVWRSTGAAILTRFGTVIWLSTMSFAIWLTPDMAAAENASGLYLYIAHPGLPHFADDYRSALSKSFIDGAAIVVQWAQIEPKPAKYNWATLDPWVQQAVMLHKKLSIGVIAGLYTPPWLYGPGYSVPKNSFAYNRSSAGVSCVQMVQPSVWNPVYLREYGNMLSSLSQHLRTMAVPGQPPGSAYTALEVIKLSGINNTTEELKVDATRPDHGPCQQSNAAAVWARAGFTPDKIIVAFMMIARETAEAFPDKLLSVSIIHRYAFPPVGNASQIESQVLIPDAVTSAILRQAIPAYGSRLLVQWNALWQGPPPPEMLAAHREGARIGWQMNGFMGNAGSGCIYPNWKIQACKTPDDFLAILENGIGLGADYIEVQLGSALNPLWTPAFENSQKYLRSGQIPHANVMVH